MYKRQPYEFCVGDGEADNVSSVELSGNVGTNSQWVVTDDQGLILGLPPMPSAVNFDVAGPGVCLIWHLSFEEGLEGLEAGNNVSDLSGAAYDLSNEIRVYRNQPEGGELTGGPYEFTVSDGIPDNVSSVELSGNSGANSQWVVTDDQGLILGLPPRPEAVNFDVAGPGVCLIWHLSYADGLEGLEAGNNALTDLVGCYDLSNSISVTRNAATSEPGNPRITMVNPVENLATVTITNFGDAPIDLSEYWLCLRPGTYRQLQALTVNGNLNVQPSQYVEVSYNVEVGVDNDGLSFYLPDTPANGGFGNASNVIDFVQWGAAGNIRESLAVAQGLWGAGDFIVGNAPYTYVGNGTQNGVSYWSASASCTADGGEITGGPYEFTVGDGEADNVSNVELSGNSGANSQWVVTDDRGLILGLPPTPSAVNFDVAGPGVCLIWHLSFADGLEGLEAGNNAFTDLVGCYDLSNSIAVTRTEVSDTTTGKSAVVFPLPATDVINVAMELDKDRKYFVTVADFAGNDVTAKTRRLSGDMALDVQALPAGIYLLRVVDDQGTSFTRKIIIQ